MLPRVSAATVATQTLQQLHIQLASEGSQVGHNLRVHGQPFFEVACCILVSLLAVDADAALPFRLWAALEPALQVTYGGLELGRRPEGLDAPSAPKKWPRLAGNGLPSGPLG